MFTIISLGLILASCGDVVPIQELGDAKLAIDSAVTAGATSYASKKLAEARKVLYEGHAFVAEEKKEEAQKKAVEARKLAEMAELITKAHLAKNKAKDEVENAQKHYDSAIDANAEMFAPNDLKKAKESLDIARAKLKETEDELQKADKVEKSDAKQYEKVIALAKETADKAKEADQFASDARKICAEQVPSIRASIRDVENTILAAETIGGKTHAAQKIETARSKAASAKALTSDMKLKKALVELNEAKINADEALLIAKKARAEEKIAEAAKVIEQAQKSLTAEAKKDQLNASKESLESAKKSHAEKRYDDSFSQSEESIRLAKIVIDAEAEMIAEKKRKEDEERQRLSGAKEGEKVSLEGQQKRLQELIDFWAKLKKESKTHKVKWQKSARQTLWRISIYYYNDVRLWPRIYRINQDMIKDPDLIYPGQHFLVPPKNLRIPNDLEPLSVLQKKLAEVKKAIEEKNQGK
jgi:nucleoid-associated protein YgaU